MPRKKRHNWTFEPKRGDFIMVYWGDAASKSGWVDSDTRKALLDAAFQTAGFFWGYDYIDAETKKGDFRSKRVVLLVSTTNINAFEEKGDSHQIIEDTIFDVRKAEVLGD